MLTPAEFALQWVLALVVCCFMVVCDGRTRTFVCPDAIFSFGTSMSDTGNSAFLFPDKTFANLPPYGSSYFGVPSQRFSDGRLVLDFLASSFGLPFLEPTFTDEALDYTHGANFAVSGALTLPYGIPYFFDVQINQFTALRARALDSLASQSHFPTLRSFEEGLYVLFFGRNDLTDAYLKLMLSPDEVVRYIVPNLVEEMVHGIKRLYEHGARNFLVLNVNPQGCQPQYLTLFGDLYSERDENGCLAAHNGVVRKFNSLLLKAVRRLRKTLTNAIIFYADFYGIVKEVYDSAQKFGFAADKTLLACCGIPAPFNYDPVARCGFTGTVDGHWVDVSRACSDPPDYVSWDGVHFTEALYKHVAVSLLTGHFLDPPINMSKACDVDFSSFDEHRPRRGGLLSSFGFRGL